MLNHLDNKDMRKVDNKYKTKLHFDLVRLISAMIIYGVFGVYSFIYFHSYISILFLITLLLLFVCSSVFLCLLGKKVEFSLFSSENDITCGDNIGIGIRINNKSIFSSLKCEMRVITTNEFMELKSENTFVLPITFFSDLVHSFNLKATYIGKVDFSLNEIKIFDFFGISYLCIESRDNATVTILPAKRTIDESVRIGIIDSIIDNNDETIKGNDIADAFDIREYIPGDRIKDIHWKLSAKKDSLLVKERSKTSENKAILFIDSSSGKKVCEEILSIAYGMLESFISEGILVDTLWFDYKNKALINRKINRKEEIKNLFEEFYDSGHGSGSFDIKHLLINAGISSGSIIRIGYFDNEVKVLLYEV